MKNKLVKTLDKVNKVRLLELARPFALGDFDLQEKIYCPPYYYDDEGKCTVTSGIHHTYELRTTPNVILHLAKVLRVELFTRETRSGEDYLSYHRRDQLAPWCSGWDINPAVLRVSISHDCSMRGIKATDKKAREAKYQKIREQQALQWKDTKGDMLRLKLGSITDALTKRIETANEEFATYMEDFIGNLNVNKEFLEKKGKGERKDLEKAVEDLDTRINELRAERTEANLKLSDFDRSLLMDAFLKGDHSVEYVNILEDLHKKHAGKLPQRLRSFDFEG